MLSRPPFSHALLVVLVLVVVVFVAVLAVGGPAGQEADRAVEVRHAAELALQPPAAPRQLPAACRGQTISVPPLLSRPRLFTLHLFHGSSFPLGILPAAPIPPLYF